MKKSQKIWLWIFILMFLSPEVLFSFITLPIFNLFGKNFDTLYSLGIKNNILPDNLTYLFIGLFVEWIGTLGLFVLSIKSKNKLLGIISGVILVFLFLISIFLYIASNMVSNMNLNW